MLQTVEVSTSRDDGQNKPLEGYRDEDVILFDEGLVGFPGCKRFVLMENEALSPFRVLQCVDQSNVGFLVLDPRAVVKNYNRSIPAGAWRALGVADLQDRLSLVISIIGNVAENARGSMNRAQRRWLLFTEPRCQSRTAVGSTEALRAAFVPAGYTDAEQPSPNASR